jgi:hypothetical protein
MGLFLSEAVEENEILNEVSLKKFMKRYATSTKGIKNIIKYYKGDISGFVEDWKEDVDEEVIDEVSRKEFVEYFQKLKKGFDTLDSFDKDPFLLKVDKENTKKLSKALEELIEYAKNKKLPSKNKD